MLEIVDLGENGFSLIFDLSGLESNHDGHAWNEIVKAHCRFKKFSVEDIIFDSESDFFAAHSASRELLEKLAKEISSLVEKSDDITAAEIASPALGDCDDDLTNEEFVEWMREVGFDMKAKQTFEFGFDSFRNKNQVAKIEEAIAILGFKPAVEIFDDEIILDVITEIIPEESALNSIEASFLGIAKKYGVVYVGYIVDMSKL